MTSSAPIGDPLEVVAALAERAANQRGATLRGVGLRLFDRRIGPVSQGVHDAVGQGRGDAVISPFALGGTYELMLSPQARRKAGAHLTPEAVAHNLVAMMPTPQPGDIVLDPAVGGAAFLMAAADQLVDAGAEPAMVITQLYGIDIDEGAVAVAEAALTLWGIDRGVAPRPLPNLYSGDGLVVDLPRCQRVVGNPPFLNQLQTSSAHSAARRDVLREKWGELVGAYTDDAWLFLAAGLEALDDDDGVLAMVQPVSVLAARHGAAVRAYLEANASLLGLWVARDRVFDAAVHVCGLVVGTGCHRRDDVERRVGADFVRASNLSRQPSPSEWGSAAATAVDVPEVRLSNSHGTIGQVASATAGFRDQFYGFVPFVSEADTNVVPDGHLKLVTVGMIDPFELAWGTRSHRFAKRSFQRPILDTSAMRADAPKLAAWADARSIPKILMATQTRVVEVWVDTIGDAVPATPVVSIEPLATSDYDLWMLAAALGSPAISAHFMASKFGTALSLNSMKLAAKDVLTAPLPQDEPAWRAASELVKSGIQSRDTLVTFAALMGEAYGSSDQVAAWWLGRVDDAPSSPSQRRN